MHISKKRTAEDVRNFATACFLLLLSCAVVAAADVDALLLAAVRANDLASAKELLAQGANPNARSDEGWTPLIIAAKAGKLEMANILIAKGADVNAHSTSETGSTALCFAADSDNSELVAALLDHGADIEVQSASGHSALYSAAAHGKKQTAIILLTRGADPNGFGNRSKSGVLYTPLMGAACEGQPELVELLLAEGARLEKRNNQGYTALMEVSKCPHPAVVKLLIAKGADVNATGPQGHTALIFAAYNGRTENIKLLLAAGADPNAKATDGDDPDVLTYDAVKLAKQQGQTEALELISRAQKQRLAAEIKP